MSDETTDQQGQSGEGLSLEEMRRQMRELQEETRLLRQEARHRVDEERELARQERDRAREERHTARDAERERNRTDREQRREGRRGGGVGFGPTGPAGPPPLPPMPPFPPIPGAGGTFTPFDFLAGFFGGPTPPKKRSRSRAGRGDVRITILLLLDEGPANGYQLMQEIEQRTGGKWKPSSGSIYPALQMLEDEGIVKTVEGEGRKMFALTDEGRRYVGERRDDWTAPWENQEDDEGASEEAVRVRDLIGQLAMAYMQVMQVGDEEQRDEAARVLAGARQAMYRILAGDYPDE